MYMGALIYYYHWLANQPLFAGFGFLRFAHSGNARCSD
jgi:hypothetical protein